MEESEFERISPTIDPVKYPQALYAILYLNGRYQREVWDAAEFIYLKTNAADMTPFIAFKPITGDHEPYNPTPGDMFAADWIPVKAAEPIE